MIGYLLVFIIGGAFGLVIGIIVAETDLEEDDDEPYLGV